MFEYPSYLFKKSLYYVWLYLSIFLSVTTLALHLSYASLMNNYQDESLKTITDFGKRHALVVEVLLENDDFLTDEQLSSLLTQAQVPGFSISNYELATENQHPLQWIDRIDSKSDIYLEGKEILDNPYPFLYAMTVINGILAMWGFIIALSISNRAGIKDSESDVLNIQDLALPAARLDQDGNIVELNPAFAQDQGVDAAAADLLADSIVGTDFSFKTQGKEFPSYSDTFKGVNQQKKEQIFQVLYYSEQTRYLLVIADSKPS